LHLDFPTILASNGPSGGPGGDLTLSLKLTVVEPESLAIPSVYLPESSRLASID